ncbi:24285_t:CDS:2, partial [Cetraspora pellucida]
ISNECHQADILYMPHNITYKYCLCIVDVASQYKWAVPLTDKTSSSVAKAFKKVYSNFRCPLIWPKLLMIDPGSEFKSDCKELIEKHNVKIKIGTSHRSQAIVERFNHTLAEKLFRLQDALDLLLPISKRSRAWVKNLPIIVNDLNNSITRLIAFNESKLSYNTSVRYLLEPGELEGGQMRVTDINWSSQGNGPRCSFVFEELQIIPSNTELPPQWVLTN